MKCSNGKYKYGEHGNCVFDTLAAYQPQADVAGHGESWARMCNERTADAADAAYDAAFHANAVTASDAASDACAAVVWAARFRNDVSSLYAEAAIKKIKRVTTPLAAQLEQEPMAYDKTEINFFVQDLYDKKMQEGKHDHYETMFHVVHQAIKRATPPQRTWVGSGDLEDSNAYQMPPAAQPLGYAHWEERIKDLMKQLPLPYSRSIAEAMKQLVNEMMQTIPPSAQPEPLICKHEWFRTSAMEPGQCRCIKCGVWNTTTPPAAQRQRLVFPTMLRKMWSGSEVQAWLDENVNKEKNI